MGLSLRAWVKNSVEYKHLRMFFEHFAAHIGDDVFSLLVQEFIGENEQKTFQMESHALLFLQFLKQKFSTWALELATIDYIRYKARTQSQILCSRYSFDPRTLKATKNGNGPEIGVSQKLHYYLFFLRNNSIHFSRLSKSEFLVLNWLRNGESLESIEKKAKLMGLSPMAFKRVLGACRQYSLDENSIDQAINPVLPI